MFQFIGRSREIAHLTALIERDGNILLKGRAGVGKKALLAELYQRQIQTGAKAIWITPSTTKGALVEIARQVHEICGLVVEESRLPPAKAAKAKRDGYLAWSDLAYTLGRLPALDLTTLIIGTLRTKNRRPRIYLPSLNIPPSQAELVAQLFEVAWILAVLDDENRRNKINRLIWQFTHTVEIQPMGHEEAQALIERELENHPLRFASERVKRQFIRHTLQASSGIPAAIMGIIHQAEKEPLITPAQAQEFSHDAGIRWLDMTPFILILVVGFIALRYVSKGMGEQELMIFAGVASALFFGLRFFMAKLSAKK